MGLVIKPTYLVLIHNGRLQDGIIMKRSVLKWYVSLRHIAKWYGLKQYRVTKRYIVQNRTKINGTVTKWFL
jgi:hypothetical protein